MNANIVSKRSSDEFYQFLVVNLPKSTAADRQIWAKYIVDHQMDLRLFVPLLFNTKTMALRMLWLFTDIGLVAPNYLYHYLPHLLSIRDEIPVNDLSGSFSNYWLIAGIPKKDEAMAIDLLFQWLNSSQTNVTAKLRAIKVLNQYTSYYPELKTELIASLQNQTAKNTPDFNQKINKYLNDLRID